MANLTYIYALVDPRDQQVRYIGKADDPQKRYWNHLADQERNHRTNWIALLRRLGLKPGLVILEAVSVEHWEEAEKRWIAKFPDLVNGTAGGDSPPDQTGYRHTEESRQRIGAASRMRTRTEECRLKIGAAHKGKTISPEHRERLRRSRLGKTFSLSEEAKAKIRLSFTPERRDRYRQMMSGRQHSEVTKTKISEALSGKPKNRTPDGKAKWLETVKLDISQEYLDLLGKMSDRALAKLAGVSPTTIRRRRRELGIPVFKSGR